MNPNCHVYSTDKRKLKIIHKMGISVNTRKVKETKDGEPAVMNDEVIKAPGHFKLFDYGKELFNNMNTTYERS